MRATLSAAVVLAGVLASAQDKKSDPILIAKPDAFKTLVNPNCSHCVDEAKRRKDELKDDDPVLCWTRGYSDGGAIPLRFFLNTYRVISDSYGVFVYDPDAGYARGFAASYNFEFHGWRNGVMVMKDKTDGTLFSCLSGVAFEGKRKGERLTPIPTIVSTWGEVMKRNPNAVAYHMFEKYKPSELDAGSNEHSLKSRPAQFDPELPKGEAQSLLGFSPRPYEGSTVVAVRVGSATKVFYGDPPFDPKKPSQPPNWTLDALSTTVGGKDVVVVSVAGTASAYFPVVRQPRKWKAPKPNKDGVSPPDAGELLPGDKELPAKEVKLVVKGGVIIDEATESKWGIDGRAYEGPLKGWTLDPVDDCVVCKYFAYVSDYRVPPAPPAPAAKEKPISGTAEFLRLLPKPFGVVKAINAKARTVSLLLDGEKTAKVWPVEPDAEVWANGFWGRLEQFKPDDKVWVWLKLDRKKQPVSVAMLADEISTDFLRHDPDNKKAPPPKFTAEQVASKQTPQREYLRKQWEQFGLPGTLTFHHVFSGELEVMLDHEGMRWGRSLKEGDQVELTADPPIKAVVKSVTPWRERTTVRLVVGELESSELKLGQRIGLKMKAPAKDVDESPYPPDIGRKRTTDERVEWFLASMYCVCPVGKDTCTGHFYTLASCNPNGCGAPQATREEIRDLIGKGKTDKDIWDALLKDRGQLMTRPHLKP